MTTRFIIKKLLLTNVAHETETFRQVQEAIV